MEGAGAGPWGSQGFCTGVLPPRPPWKGWTASLPSVAFLRWEHWVGRPPGPPLTHQGPPSHSPPLLPHRLPLMLPPALSLLPQAILLQTPYPPGPQQLLCPGWSGTGGHSVVGWVVSTKTKSRDPPPPPPAVLREGRRTPPVPGLPRGDTALTPSQLPGCG